MSCAENEGVHEDLRDLTSTPFQVHRGAAKLRRGDLLACEAQGDVVFAEALELLRKTIHLARPIRQRSSGDGPPKEMEKARRDAMSEEEAAQPR